MNVKVQVAVLVVVGLVLVVGSLVFQMRFNSIFKRILEGKLKLTPGSKTLESFKAPPVPIFMQFYFFNLTNKDEVMAGATPVLQQVGPYTYDEKQLKYDLEFNDEVGTVTYRQNKSFYFRPDLSEGHSENDQITTINAVMMSLGSKFSSLAPILKTGLEMFFLRFRTEPFLTRPVKELLFEGYEEPMLRFLADFTKDPVHATGRFGFFFPKNNTNDGTTTVYTGTHGMDTYQNILYEKGKTKLDFWREDMWGRNTCNMINGTSGNQFPQPISKSRPLRLYTAELCRSIYAEFQKEVYHGPVTLYRYALPERLLANSEENRCYCNPDDDFTCRASMINVGPCRNGAPVVMSTPHFYQGTPEDVAQVHGLAPRAEEHETYLDIEPNTGVTFRAAKRIQVNMPLRRYSNLPAFANVPEIIYPILWVNESAVVPMERTKALHRTLTLPFTIVTIGSWVLVTLGVVLVIAGLVKAVLAYRAANAEEKPTARNRRGRQDMDKGNGVNEKLNTVNYS